jgi:hypothetical protein
MSEHLNIEAAKAILIAASDVDPNAQTETDPELLRQSLLNLATVSDYQIFGVCADNQTEALIALKSYAKAFGCEMTSNIEESSNSSESIYLKFNPRINRLHKDVYAGKYRGVLISYQSDYTDGHSGTYGHFPLELFA